MNPTASLPRLRMGRVVWCLVLACGVATLTPADASGRRQLLDRGSGEQQAGLCRSRSYIDGNKQPGIVPPMDDKSRFQRVRQPTTLFRSLSKIHKRHQTTR